MKIVVVALTVASLTTSCVDSDPESLSSGEQEVGVKPGHCPDPGDCSVANGGGIYTEEGGHIGVVTSGLDFMVARFVNSVDATTGPYVAWEGRAEKLPGGPGHYGPQGGAILYAQYGIGDGVTPQYNVTHVDETGTVPVFTLVSASDPAHPFTVTNDQLYNLRLIITTPIAFSFFRSTIFFSRPNKPSPEYTTVYNSSDRAYKYALYWYEGEDPLSHGAPVSFCQGKDDGSGTRAPDFAVFQRGIDVDPLTARTNFHAPNTVTLSCSLGAISTAYVWGYPYRTTTTPGGVLFESVMHMKRASYCGDVTTYTQSGTRILMYDGVIHSNPQITTDNAEAIWGRAADGKTRALCVTHARERHPELLYPPVGGQAFTGQCFPDDGTAPFVIPQCPHGSFPGAVVADTTNLR